MAGDTLGDLFNVDGEFSYLPQFLEARAQDLTEYLSGDAILEYPFLANLSDGRPGAGACSPAASGRSRSSAA